MNYHQSVRSLIVGTAAVLLSSIGLRATPTDFTIDDSQSQITLSGTVVGNTVQEQATGSLSTAFYGTIKADVTAAQIQFTGGSSVTAHTNGVWKPGPGGTAGSAPADYGAKATTILGTLTGALRNLLLDMKSGPLNITSGTFDASALLFLFPTNTTASFDFDAGFLGSGGIALSGISTNRIVNGATLTSTADGQTLTIQIDTEFKFKAFTPDDSSVHLTGKLVAATKPSLPDITSIEIKNQIVTLHTQGAGSAPRLDSSTNLVQWITRNPTIAAETGGAALSVPVNGPSEFYRVAK